jgi:predicted MFS family arabinose efflux permease
MSMKPTRNLSLIFSLIAVPTILLVLGFGGALSISSFKKHYTESLVAGYAVAGGEGIRSIENGVNEGETLELFFGVTELLASVQKDSPGIDDVRVILPDGRIIDDLRGAVDGAVLPGEVVKQLRGSAGNLTVLIGKDYHTLLCIRETGAAIVGYLDLVFEKRIVDDRVNEFLGEMAFLLFIIGAVAALVIMLVLRKVTLVTEVGEIRKRILLAVMISALGLTQVVFGLVNISAFIRTYVDMASTSAGFTARIIQKELNKSLKSEVPLESLTGIEEWLDAIAKGVPEIEGIQVNGAGRTIYSTMGAGEAAPVRADPRFVVSLPLTTDSLGVTGALDVRVSKRFVDRRVMNIAMDGLTVLLTSWFFMVEITLFLLIFLKHQLGRELARSSGEADRTAGGVDFTMVRSLAFLFFTATSMSISFIPVLMRGFKADLFGLSPGLVMGIPVSVEVFASILSTVITGRLLDGKGWRPLFLLGTAFLGAGTILSALSGDAWTFILARGVVGIGYGFCWMALRGFASAAPSEEGRSGSFAALNAGIYAGINCGCVTGAMLSERIGFSPVFFVALAVAAMAALFALAFFRNVKTEFLEAPGGEEIPSGQVSSGSAGLLGFLANGSVFGFFLLVAIPTAVSAVFINYFLPVFSVEANVSASNTGRVILLYGMCIVYLGPLLSRYAIRAIGAKGATLVSSLLMAGGLLAFAATGNFLGALIAALVLGIADSFGMVSQNNYFLGLPAVRREGVGKALGLLSIMKKLGQMVGPLALGALLGLGMARGMGLTGVLLLICTILFALVSRGVANRAGGSSIP